jgi:hypothetical protein
MPLNNAIGSFSLGRDTQIVLLHPLAPGGRVDIPNVTAFHPQSVYKQNKRDRLDGNNVEAAIPAGYTFTISFDRAGPQADDLQVLIDAAWHVNGSIQNATLYRYVTEPSGSTSVYMLTDCSLMISDLGALTADAVVKQTITGSANRMVKV